MGRRFFPIAEVFRASALVEMSYASPRPPCLRRYVRVKKWEEGYIEVDADYGHGEEEDYIDLLPILNNLYYDAKEFLRPIRKVEVRYE